MGSFFFSIEKESDTDTNTTEINKTTCNNYCEQLYNQYKEDIETKLVFNKKPIINK
mgnify:CR=1 FL=1